MRNTNRSDALSTRRFGTTDLAIVLALWSAMAVLVGGVMSELASDSETPMAKAQSEAYAHQLASTSGEIGEGGEKDGPALRGPASVASSALGASSLPVDPKLRSGKLGRDPWGKPYSYRIVNSAVIVWSAGRNQEPDSEKALERLESGQPVNEFRFMGDDVGFVQVSHNSNSYR